jgi:hypothetical protein
MFAPILYRYEGIGARLVHQGFFLKADKEKALHEILHYSVS